MPLISGAIQPAALLTGAGQLLALALDGEIEQQGPQLQHLGAADDDAIEAMATAEAALQQAPIAAEQQVVVFGIELLGRQPSQHRRRQAEAGLNAPPLATAPQQAGSGRSLGAAQQGIEGIEED